MNELKHNEFYSCKRLRLLQFLMERGFMPESEIPDPTNIRYKWWIFRNTPELEIAIDEYFERYQKNNR